MIGRGFLAIWSDIDAQLETDYVHWLTHEHTTERVSTDGFMAVRVFRALKPVTRRYLIIYELESPDVVNSPAYLDKLNNPTPWTQRTLPILKNFMRGGGRLSHSAGTGHGGFVVAVTLRHSPADGKKVVATLVQCDRVVAARLYETDQERTAVKTKEKVVRHVEPGADDRSFSGVLLIEGIDESSLEAAIARLSEINPDMIRHSTVGATVYTSVFTLEKRIL
jgi:hypothetical protein